jgi:isopenicillin N synthase-like dioxygenase
MHSHISPSKKPENIPVAPLEVIYYDKLLSGSPSEIGKLVDICKSLGFFYLNLTGAAQSVLDGSRDAFQFMEGYFDQPLEVKLRDIRQSVTHG